MMARVQVSLSLEEQRRAKERAAQLGISFAEYVRRLVSRDLREPGPGADVSVLFNLGRSEGSDVGDGKDRMLGEAFEAAH